MPSSYSGDPASSAKDFIRFYIYDRKDPWLFTDEEINYAIGEYTNVWIAASELALVQYAKYADKRDKAVGPLSIKYGETAERWLNLSKILRGKSSRSSSTGAIFANASSDPNAALRGPYFKLGMHDNPAAKSRNELIGE